MDKILMTKRFTIGAKLKEVSHYSFLCAVFVLPFSKALLEISLGISVVSWFLFKILSNESLACEKKIPLIAGLFIIFSSISAFYSGYPDLSALGVVKIIKYVLTMMIAADFYRDERRLKQLLYGVLISFFFLLLDTIYQRVNGKDLVVGLPIHYTDLQVRLTGPYTFYGLLGAHLIAFLPIMFSLILSSLEGKRRWIKSCLLIPLFFLSVYVLYKTHSRGAWLASAGSWIFYAYMSRRKMISIVVIVLVLIAPFVIPKNALIHLDIEKHEQSLFERYRLWERAIQVIVKEPLFGCGINTYIRNYPKYDEVKSWRVPGYYAHNGYLQMAAETGLISLGLFLLLVIKGIRDSFFSIQRAVGARKILLTGLLCGFIALLFQTAVDTILHNLQTAIMIWGFLGLLYAVSSRYKSDETDFNT